MPDTKAKKEAGEEGRPRSQGICQPGVHPGAEEGRPGIKAEENALCGSESQWQGMVWGQAQKGQFRVPWRPAVWQIRVAAEGREGLERESRGERTRLGA